MSVPEAQAGAAIMAIGIVRVEGGYSLVRLRVKGERVCEALWTDPNPSRAEVTDEFKKAAARSFIMLDSPLPEARKPVGVREALS